MINAGKANQRLHFDDGVLYLNLSGGDACHHVKKKRETIIQFVCNSSLGSDDLGQPVFIFEDDCTYYMVWHTSLACERQVCTKHLRRLKYQISLVIVIHFLYASSENSVVHQRNVISLGVSYTALRGMLVVNFRG